MPNHRKHNVGVRGYVHEPTSACGPDGALRRHDKRRLRWLCAWLLFGSGGISLAHAQAPAEPPAPATEAPAASPEITAAPVDAPGIAQPTAVDIAPTMEHVPAAEESASDSAAGWGDMSEMEVAGDDAPVFRTKMYGFIDYHAEKVAKTPDSVNENGETVYVKNPWELDILNLNVMLQGSIYDKYRFFLNLAAPSSGSNVEDASLLVRNAWMEAPVLSRYIIVRAGKLYRRFGLYNEILDAVPTFIGIEAPEMFDKDHLILTRTTNLMVHGSVDVGSGVLNYSVSSGQDERDPGSFPVGGDLNVELPWGLKLGTSFYSSGGEAVPGIAVGDGSPKGGVINWMAKDKYSVFGGYVQLRKAGVILQAEYWRANHDGVRDPDSMALLAADGSLNPAQMRRFYVDGDPDEGIHSKAKYSIDTAYFRGGYEIAMGQLASITPYMQVDYYSNPETVNNKDLGGDNEAGLTDNGKFEKYTLGAVLRPVTQVALKVDGSGHRQKFNGKSEFYPEVRISISYLWELAL